MLSCHTLSRSLRGMSPFRGEESLSQLLFPPTILPITKDDLLVWRKGTTVYFIQGTDFNACLFLASSIKAVDLPVVFLGADRGMDRTLSFPSSGAMT